MDPLTIILTNAAITAYNSWQNNRNNKELQEKQRAFLRAAEDRKDRLMWSLMRESQEISAQMEYDLHQQRIEELERDFGQLVEKTAKQVSVNTWPLRVLPIVMKNQSLGNILVKRNDNISLHCILTPSNCESFNQVILPVLDRQLEDYFNEYWSPLSQHSVLFYGGAWNSKCCPTGTEIRQLQSHLQSLPTLVVTPYFKENESGLVFKLHGWGMGYDFKVGDIMPIGFSYQGDTYNKETDFVANEELRYTTIEDFTPYLQCLIGYFADQYFWNGYGTSPQLMKHIESGIISTDGQLHLLEQYRSTYQELADKLLSDEENVVCRPEKCLKLCSASTKFMAKADVIIKSYCKTTNKNYNGNIKDFVDSNSFRREEFQLLDALTPFVGSKAVNKKKSEYWERYHLIVPKFEFEKKTVLTFADLLRYGKENIQRFPEADSFEIFFLDKDFSVLCFFTRHGHVEHNEDVGVKGFLSTLLYIPVHLAKETHIVVRVSELDYKIYESERDMNALDIANLLNNEGSKNRSNINQNIVNKFESAKAEFINEMERQYLERKAEEEGMLDKMKETLDTAYETASSTVSETMDEAQKKLAPVLEDIKGRFGSFLSKRK